MIASMLVLSADCVAPNGPIGGTMAAVYSDVSGPMAVGTATGSSKVGTATSKGVICVVWGDSSIKTACANGGITKIHHVDYHLVAFWAFIL